MIMKTKKLLKLLWVPLLVTIAGCGNQQKSDIGVHLWYAYASENLISDWDYLDEKDPDNADFVKRDSTLRFTSMKNENEGIQLMITPDHDIQSFDFILPDVIGPNGTITKDHFTVAAAYYMNVEYSNERTAVSGLYPDALIPLKNYKMRKMDRISAGMNQSLYINLKTTEDTPAGEYEGIGKLIIDGESINIPFEVKIFDAVMPNENHVRSSFLIWYDQIPLGEKQNADADMNNAYFEFAVSKRLSPGELPPELSSYSNFDYYIKNYIEKVVKDERVAASRLPITTNSMTKNNARTLLQKMIDKNIELRQEGDTTIDLFKKAYFYMDDEPAPAQYETVKQHDKDIFDVKVELAPQLANFPDLYASFVGIENIVTTPYNETLNATNEVGGVHTWCPQVQNFQTPEGRELYKERQNSTDRDFGEKVWWYVCNDPIMPYPNYHLDAKLITSRVLRYMEYDYGIDGNLFWNICWYSKQLKGTAGPRDIWNDPLSWESCAGDGMLVYPGLTFGIYGPITTLRMESIMAGFEEYEYMWMIDQKVQEFNALNDTTYVTTDLLQKYFTRLYTDMISNLDVNALEEVRTELLSVVENLYGNLNDGMSSLLK
ncbi:MAG: glycoside hydrolase domain-containing protein [Bacilli bacterium]